MNVMRCNQDIFRGAEAQGSLSTSPSRCYFLLLCDKVDGFLAYPAPVSLPSFGAFVTSHLPSGAPSALFNSLIAVCPDRHAGCSMVVARKEQAVRHSLRDVAHKPMEHPSQSFNLISHGCAALSYAMSWSWHSKRRGGVSAQHYFNMCYGQQLCEGAAKGSTLRKAACRTRSGRGFNSPRLHQN